jgi:hypothetical protein
MDTTIKTGLNAAGAAALPIGACVPACPVLDQAKRTQDLAAGLSTLLSLVSLDDAEAEAAEFEGAEHQRALSPQARYELVQMAIAVARDIADGSARHHQWADRHAAVTTATCAAVDALGAKGQG